ncbi:hypothetical protein Tco_1467373, partial [Tanacetum coccineum]
MSCYSGPSREQHEKHPSSKFRHSRLSVQVLRTKYAYEVHALAVISVIEDHWRRPTLGLLVLPSVSPFPPTIRRTARISIPPIEPNLAERARIATINLDDYQHDPVTPPPSPSSPFLMAAYQRMISETDPAQREEALTAYGTGI